MAAEFIQRVKIEMYDTSTGEKLDFEDWNRDEMIEYLKAHIAVLTALNEVEL